MRGRPAMVLVFLLSFLASSLPSWTTAQDASPGEARPRVVIAVIDDGINLYHQEYRGDAAWTVPGAQSVSLTLDAATWDEARARDAATLGALRLGTLYAFPGTKIVGAISFGGAPEGWPLLLGNPDEDTHGTMTSSRAVGNSISIPATDPDVGLVFVQGLSVDAVEWAAAQPWIDVISISSGLGGILEFVPAASNPTNVDAFEAFQAAAHAKPFFASTGNGVGNVGMAGFPSWLRGASGAPDVVSVGAVDQNEYSFGYNLDPYVAADACRNPAAEPADLSAVTNWGGGTSSATPFAAGGGARLLLEARRILGDDHLGPRVDPTLPIPPVGWKSGHDGDAQVVLARGPEGLVTQGPLADGMFTLLELKDLLYHSALAVPTLDVTDGAPCLKPIPGVGGDVPNTLPAAVVAEPARFPLSGYGEINRASVASGMDVLAGRSVLGARLVDDLHYQRVHAMKSAVQHESVQQALLTGESIVQNDAGTGGDAPNVASDRIRIESGRLYQGNRTGALGDEEDWYAFDVNDGDVVEVRFRAESTCVADFADPWGRRQAVGCTFPLLEHQGTTVQRFTIPEGLGGRWFWLTGQAGGVGTPSVPDAYRFGLGINGPAPIPPLV